MAATISPVQVDVYLRPPSDHYTLCEINNIPFALFDRALGDGEVRIDLEGYNLLFLRDVEADDIYISAVTVLVLGQLRSREGCVHVRAEKDFIQLGTHLLDLKTNRVEVGRATIQASPQKEYLAGIIAEFRKGLENQDPQHIVDALMGTYDAICDPKGLDESLDINVPKALEFFGIPIQEDTGDFP